MQACYLSIYIFIFQHVNLSTYLFIYLQSDARPGAAGGGDEAHWPDQLWPDARSGQVKREVIYLFVVKYILDEWVLKHSTTFICLIVQSSGVVSEWEIFRFDWRWCMGSGWHPSNSQTSQPLQSYQPHTHTGDTRLLRNWGFSSLKPGQVFNRGRYSSWRSDAYSCMGWAKKATGDYGLWACNYV